MPAPNRHSCPTPDRETKDEGANLRPVNPKYAVAFLKLDFFDQIRINVLSQKSRQVIFFKPNFFHVHVPVCAP
jgi:hypothetical protein